MTSWCNTANYKSSLKFILILVIPFFIFYLWMPLQILNIANVEPLLFEDLGIYIVGEHIMRHTPFGFPLFNSNLAHYPYEAPIIYTTIGLFSFITIPIAKIFCHILPEHIQIIGWQFLVGLYGLFLAAYAIFKKFGLSFFSAILAALLVSLSPPFFARAGHGIMTWHFVILLGFYYLFFTNKNVLIKGTLINLLSFSIYTYFLPITFVITSVKPFFNNNGSITFKVVKETSSIILMSLFTVAIYAYLIGFWGVVGPTNGLQYFGHFSMNINAIINSQGMSNFFSALPLGTKGQYEGFQYIGLGALFFISFTFIFLKEKIFTDNQFYILLAYCVFFTLLALSNKIYFGSNLLLEYKVTYLENIFGTIRASGRLFWAVLYLLIIVAIVKAWRSINKYNFMIFIAICILIQVIEVKIPNQVLFQAFNKKDSVDNDASKDKELDTFLSGLTKKPHFLELDFWNEPLNSKNNYKAILTSIDHGIPVTRLYTSRNTHVKEYKPKITPAESLKAGGAVLLNSILLSDMNILQSDIQFCKVGNYFVALPSQIQSTFVQCKTINVENVFLDTFLNIFPQKIIAISVSDEASNNLHQYSVFLEAMKSIGSNIDKLHWRQSYIGLIYKGKLIYEKISDTKLQHEYSIENFNIKITSQGLLSGSASSSILVNNKDFSPNKRGLNIVAIDEDVIFSANYDTFLPPPPRKIQDGILFSYPGLPLILENLEGLSHSEAWGRWSNELQGLNVQLDFKQALPQRFTLALRVMALGPNVGAPVFVKIGQHVTSFTPTKSMQMEEFRLPFDLNTEERSIIITPPHPVTPQSLGINNDTRRLGIGFEWIRFEGLP